MHDHHLTGCATRPLASYLKALGVLRLIGEQADSGVCGWWSGNEFHCKTVLGLVDMEDFFVQRYAPTPLVAPWNGASGFFPGDPQEGIQAIERSEDPRFQSFRETLSVVRAWPEINPGLNTLDDLRLALTRYETESKGKAKKEAIELLEAIARGVNRLGLPDEELSTMPLSALEIQASSQRDPAEAAWSDSWNAVKKGRTKALQAHRDKNKGIMLALCRAKLPDDCLPWLDAAFVLGLDETASYNPILGTGGNEGHLDFTNNFMQQVAGLLIDTNEEVRRTLWRSAILGDLAEGMRKGKIGQYDPGKAGGSNQGIGIENKGFKINPWDYVLTLEGTLMFASALVRKSSTEYRGSLSSPFSVRFSPVGFTSSERTEDGRGEVWLPLWKQPASLPELKQLFAEGRSSLRGKPVRNGMEFARAIGLLGIDRGISAFERFAFLQRRGQSYVALPAGRIPVHFHPELERLGDLDSPLKTVDQFLREFKNPPASLLQARRSLDDALFACSRNPTPLAFQEVFRGLGRLDSLLSGRDRKKRPALARPLYGLSTKWMEACDDGGVEVRLAAAVASIKPVGGVGSFRSGIAPVLPDKPWIWAAGAGQSAWKGGTVSERLGDVLLRRMMDAQRTSTPHPPFDGSVALAPEDAAAFAMGLYDPVKLEELLWAFSLVGFGKGVSKRLLSRWSQPVLQLLLPREWCLLKLLHSPHPVGKVAMRLEPRISRLLRAGRVQEACDVAQYRLRVAGMPPFEAAYESSLAPTDLLASLMIPVFHQQRLERAVLLPSINTQ